MGWTNVRYALEDHGILDREIRETGMDWTLVRATRLVFEGEGADVETLGSEGLGMRMSDCVNVQGAARFLVKVAVEGLFVGSAVVVRDR